MAWKEESREQCSPVRFGISGVTNTENFLVTEHDLAMPFLPHRVLTFLVEPTLQTQGAVVRMTKVVRGCLV